MIPRSPMKNLRTLIILTAALLAVPSLDATKTGGDVAPTRSAASATQREPKSSNSIEYGKASWYCIKCNGGTHTASGKRLNDWAMTAAHKTLPMGSKVRVTNKANGRSAVVTITDRGPYIKGRIIDVTKGVAHKLGFITSGVVPCKVEVL